jgi:fatty acid desaturase
MKHSKAKNALKQVRLPVRRKRRRKAVIGSLVGLAAVTAAVAAIPATLRGLTEWVGRGIKIRSLED